MRVYLNKHAACGTGGRRWAKIERALRPRLGEATVEEICSPEGLGDQVRRALDAGERTFVAAGGDGTVNLLLNALMCSASAGTGLTIGAVGLGSSNDFHKPLAGRPTIRGVPLRIAVHRAAPADVIRLEYHAQGGRRQTRYCLMNASIGVTAEANHAFNTRGRLLRAAQKLSVEAARSSWMTTRMSMSLSPTWGYSRTRISPAGFVTIPKCRRTTARSGSASAKA
jgi:diacylglycerol kinase (ATP)